jgi:hypothetical protein
MIYRFYILLLIITLSACTSKPPIGNPPWIGKYKNACLPEAIVMTEGLLNSGIQAKVMSIHTEKWGHAVCVYLYPTGHNRLWVWDSHWQSIPLNAWWDSSDSIAKAWMKWRHDTSPLINTYFLTNKTR